MRVAVAHHSIIVVLLTVLSAADAQAQQFVSFDDWDTVCPSIDGASCDAYVTQSGGGEHDLLTEPSCPVGGATCLEARYAGPETASVRLYFDATLVSGGHTLYFESMVYYEAEPTNLNRLFVAVDGAGGFEFKASIGGDQTLVLDTFDLEGGAVRVDRATTPLPIMPGQWGRVGVLIENDPGSNLLFAKVWFGDDDVVDYDAPLVLFAAGATRSPEGFDDIWALGEPALEGSAVTLRVDDLCVAPEAGAREGFCRGLRQSSGEPVLLPPPVDAGVDGAVDSGPYDGGVATDAGVPGDDRGPFEASGVDFRGAGGCACAVGSQPQSTLPIAWAGFILAGFALNRLRRRS